MLQLISSNKHVLTKTIVVSLVLMAMPFKAGAQESDIDRKASEGKIPSCAYNWDCFDVADLQRETILFHLFGLKCPEEESEVGWVRLSGPKGTKPVGSFYIDGLEFSWLFGEGGSEDYQLIVEADGTGLYYDLSNVEERESARPSQVFACVDRSEKFLDLRLWKILHGH